VPLLQSAGRQLAVLAKLAHGDAEEEWFFSRGTEAPPTIEEISMLMAVVLMSWNNSVGYSLTGQVPSKELTWQLSTRAMSWMISL